MTETKELPTHSRKFTNVDVFSSFHANQRFRERLLQLDKKKWSSYTSEQTDNILISIIKNAYINNQIEVVDKAENKYRIGNQLYCLKIFENSIYRVCIKIITCWKE